LSHQAVASCLQLTELAADEITPINVLVYLINTHTDAPITGLLWRELDLRECGLTAMVKVSNPVLATHSGAFCRLSTAGNENISGYFGLY